MKIAFIADRVYPFYRGGYEYLIYNLANELSAFNDITIYTSMNDPFQKINNVNFVKISKTYKFTDKNGSHNKSDAIKFAVELLLNINKFKNYDIVIMNSIPYLLYGYFLKKLRVKKIILFHEAWYHYLRDKNLFFRYILYHEIKSIVENSNIIIAVSSATKKSLMENYNAKSVYRIPIGIYIREASNHCKINYDIVYIGRLAKIKHVEIIIRVAKNLKLYYRDIKIAIVGEGGEKRMLAQMVQDLDLKGNIFFLGNVDDTYKYCILACSKVFVMPSEREGFSTATLEAMAYGCVPVVAKPKYDEVFGASDFVINNITGLYFKLNDSNDLYEKILKLFSDDKLYNQLKICGMKRAKHYKWDNIVKLYNDILLKWDNM